MVCPHLRFLMLFLITLIGSATTAAGTKEYVYHQVSGRLTLQGKVVGQGYSGFAEGKNNPGKQGVRNVGPIPQGLYRMGPPRTYKSMPNCLDLIPVGHDALGRSEFLIHGDNKKMDGSASRGCIILPPDVRKQIVTSKIKHLRVVEK